MSLICSTAYRQFPSSLKPKKVPELVDEDIYYVCTEFSAKNFVNRYFPSKEQCFCPAIPQGELLLKSGLDDTMVSRRKILSRSRDDLNMDSPQEEEDVWFQKERLFKDHVQEILNKWRQIDDEIWAKVIVLERNRRVAKAYARAPVLTINGSDDGFDGYRIGLGGFDNPLRDARTIEIKKRIGHGVKIKMDEAGNIMIKRVSKSNVYVKEINSVENSIANDIIMAGGLLELEKPSKLFDMKKFSDNVNRELRRAYPDRRKLESQCISAIAFVKDNSELLDCSCWVMIINVVALDMLKSKLPPVSKRSSMEKSGNRHQLPDEDPYSVLNNSEISMGADTFKELMPPKLPPRDNRVPVPMPDYDDWKREKPSHRMQQQSGLKSSKDDPYCCGMRARVPNFGKDSDNLMPPVRKSHSSGYLSLLRQNDKTFESSMDESFNEEHSRFYGRMRTLYNPTNPGALYIGEWEGIDKM